MSDDKLIRRRDALKFVEMGADWWNAHEAISALPTVDPMDDHRVKALIARAEAAEAALREAAGLLAWWQEYDDGTASGYAAQRTATTAFIAKHKEAGRE